MNSLYTLALRQTASIQQDLVSLEQALNPSPTGLAGPSSALNGQITASLAALDRTVEDYDNMARREIVEAKRDKALRYGPSSFFPCLGRGFLWGLEGGRGGREQSGRRVW